MQNRSTLLAFALFFLAFNAHSQTPSKVPDPGVRTPLANKIGDSFWRDMNYPPGSIWRRTPSSAAPKVSGQTEWTLVSATDIHGGNIPIFFKPLSLFLGHNRLITRGCNTFNADTSEEEGRLKLNGALTTVTACFGPGGLMQMQRDEAIQAHLSDRPHMSLQLWGTFEPRLYLTRDNGDTLEFTLVH